MALWPWKEERESALSEVHGELDEEVSLSTVLGCGGRDPGHAGRCPGQGVGGGFGTQRKGGEREADQLNTEKGQTSANGKGK